MRGVVWLGSMLCAMLCRYDLEGTVNIEIRVNMDANLGGGRWALSYVIDRPSVVVLGV